MSTPKLYKDIPAPFFMPNDVVYYESPVHGNVCVSTIKSMDWNGSFWFYEVFGCVNRFATHELTLMPESKYEVFE